MGKPRVAIVTDSTATIPSDLVKKYQIKVIPQCLIWEEKTYRDGIDITPREFYERLKNSKDLPTTSQPSAGEFFEFFSKVAEGYDEILGIFISDELSGTVDSARAARDMLPELNIEIIDSRSASMGLGFITLAAARSIEQGQNLSETADIAKKLVPLAKAIFVVDTLEYLHRGGRIGGAKRLVGSMLSIKPVLHLEDGRIEPLASLRTKRKAIDRALEIVSQDVAGKGPIHACVIHAAAPQEAAEFQGRVKQLITPVELLVCELSPVVGTYTGPGLVGLAYYCEPV